MDRQSVERTEKTLIRLDVFALRQTWSKPVFTHHIHMDPMEMKRKLGENQYRNLSHGITCFVSMSSEIPASLHQLGPKLKFMSIMAH